MKISSYSGDFPWAHRIAEHMPMPKVGIEEAYKKIRNRLRKYSASSIIDAALLILWNPSSEKLEEIKAAPWLTLLIVKWALQDSSSICESGTASRWRR
jgi:hypothetical protein